MNLLFQKSKNYFYFLLCFLTTWIILGAIPALQLQGMFKQVDTQILILHLFGGLLYIVKGIEGLILKEKIKELNNIFFIIPLMIGLVSLLSASVNNYFFTTILGSYQIGQGALWYFDFAILILFFSSIIGNYKLRVFLFINVVVLTFIVSLFTLFPFWKGINISFFYFSDYLCYFGIISFILFTSLIKNKLIIFVSYCFLGWYLSLLDNRAAMALWAIILLAFIIYEVLSLFLNNKFIKKLKNILFSNLVFTLSIFLLSFLILFSAFIFWRGDGALPSEIGSSPLASLVVRGKLLEIVFSEFFTFKNLLIGEGWGRISDLLLVQMDAWQFDQLTVGFNLHFHTHNEIFEHFFSLGIPGLLLFIFLIFYTFKYSESISIYNKLGWLLFFYVSCFWFFWAGTLSIFALALATLTCSKRYKIRSKNNLIERTLTKYSYLISLSFFIIGFFALYGSYLSYTYTKEYKKISYQELASFSSNQNILKIQCNGFYNDKKGGETVARFMNTFPEYLNTNKIEYNETYLKILATLQCISEEIIFSSEPTINLLSSSILFDSKLFFSKSELVKNLTSDPQKYENLKKKVFKLTEKAPKRGDLIMPFIAISFKINRLDVISDLCAIPNVRGIEGYCNLIYAYQTLNSKYPSNTDIRKSISFLKKAIDGGILEEKVYGWWFFENVSLNVSGYSSEGFPISPDIIFYISNDEASKLLNIIENIEN